MTGFLMSGIGAPTGAVLEYDYDIETVARYFEARARRSLPTPAPWPAPVVPPQFRRASLALPDGPPNPAIANV